jgi:hypothetical protein
MSWGYFVDLKLTMPSDVWAKVREQKPGGFPLKAGWSGFAERSLEKAFGRPWSERDSFSKLLKGKAFHGSESVHHVDEIEGHTSIRICLMLDKSTLDLAYPLATLFYAAHESGAASGSLRIVNDGTAAGEDGVEITLTKTKVTKAKIADSFVIVEELMGELYGDLVSAPLKGKSSKALSKGKKN